jgi:hypothetical protein
VNPVSAFFQALDRGVEKVSDVAFESAINRQKSDGMPHLSPRQKVLVLVDKNRPEDAPTADLQDAVKARLVKDFGHGKYELTTLGRYVLPEFAGELQGEDQSAPERTSSPALS